MYNRISGLLNENNPSLSKNEKFTIKPPNMGKLGSKKSAWTNFPEICQAMNRPEEHVMSYVQAEFSTEAVLGGDKQMILKGRFGQKQMESLLKKYINDYVRCVNCRSMKTFLDKDAASRLYIMKCKACGAHRSVNTIRAGY